MFLATYRIKLCIVKEPEDDICQQQ